MSYINLETARKVMRSNGLDALVATTPTNIFYTSSYFNIVIWMPGITVTPADPGLEPVIIISSSEEGVVKETSHIKDIRSYPVWSELVDVKDIIEGKLTRVTKPRQFDIRGVYALLSDTLKDKGLHKGTIGIEMGSVTHRIYSLLLEQNPEAKFVDAEGILGELQRVKTTEGIEALRAAAAIGVKGIQGMIEGGVLGATVGELQAKYKRRVVQEITDDNALCFAFGRGAGIITGGFLPSMQLAKSKVSPGDNVAIDCGVVVDGHVSDLARTFVAGRPSPLQQKVYGALKAGYEKALSMMRPGVKINEIYNAAQETIRENGLDWLTRGHFGHSVGIFPPIEQPPWICADEERELEPNMVMCLETPLFVSGLGAFLLEDMILITPEGHEVLSELPREMVEL